VNEKLNIIRERLLQKDAFALSVKGRILGGGRLANPDGPAAVAFIESREALIERLTEALTDAVFLLHQAGFSTIEHQSALQAVKEA
jgi:hypothetical protein